MTIIDLEQDMPWDEAETIARQLEKELQAARQANRVLRTARQAKETLAKLIVDRDALIVDIDSLRATVKQASQDVVDAEVARNLKRDIVNADMQSMDSDFEDRKSKANAAATALIQQTESHNNTLKALQKERDRIGTEHEAWKASVRKDAELVEADIRSLHATTKAALEAQMASEHDVIKANLHNEILEQKAELDRAKNSLQALRDSLPHLVELIQ